MGLNTSVSLAKSCSPHITYCYSFIYTVILCFVFVENFNDDIKRFYCTKNTDFTSE